MRDYIAKGDLSLIRGSILIGLMSTKKYNSAGHLNSLRSFMGKQRIRHSFQVLIGMMGCNVSQLAWNFASLPQLIRSAKSIFYMTDDEVHGSF